MRSTAGLPRLYQKYVGPRQQPRFLHVQPAGDRGVQPADVHRVVPADHVQPAPDRPGRHGAVRAAVPRSLQLQLRPAGADGHRARGRGHAQPVHRSRARPGAVSRNEASYSTWFNGGVRTTTCFHNLIGILTEIIGNPTPMQIPLHARPPAADTSKPMPIAPQEWHQKQSIDYLIDLQPGHPRHRVAPARGLPLQHLPDGEELDRARQQGQLDGHAEADRRGAGGGGAGPSGGRRRGRADGGGGGRGRRRRPRSTSRCCASRRTAIRAATSCRRTSRISRPRRSSSTR